MYPSTDPYILRSDDVGARRLQLVNDAYGQASRWAVDQCGLFEGDDVVELGCGTGQMTGWLAERVGPSGRVCAIDRSAEQLSFAAEQCRDYPWVAFTQSDAASTELTPASFDLAFIRLLLMHVPHPDRALAHARSLLRPGGLLLCQEIVISSTFCYPPRAAQAELQRMALDLAAARGCDFDIGARLPELIATAGLTIVGASACQPTSATDDTKHIENLSLREAIPFFEGPEQIANANRLCDALALAADDPLVVYGQARMVQVWAQRPYE